MTHFAHAGRAALGCATVMLVASGCTWTGLNGMALPFTKGGGDDNIEITVKLANAANLVPNSEVKYDEVTIGSVRRIELKDWTATLTVGLEGDAKVPADVTARVAQKSLLGAEYLELADPDPATQARSDDFLADDDVIGLGRTGRYPETEEVLAAGSMLLNGGGLQQIRETAHELNAALSGRATDIQSFLHTANAFTERLDGQRDNIAATLEQLDRLSRVVVRDEEKIAHALEDLPRGFEVLSRQRRELVRALRAVDSFGKVADRVIGATKADLEGNLNYLRPITRELARNGKTLADSVDMVTYPFPIRNANNTLFGDYLNLVASVNINHNDIARDWLGGTPLDGLFNGIIGSPLGPVGDATDSLDDLLSSGDDGLLGGTGLLQGQGTSSGSQRDDKKDGVVDGLVGGLLGGQR